MNEFDWKTYNYCDEYELAEYRYFWPASQHFVCDNATEVFCRRVFVDMIVSEKHSSETLPRVWHIFCTILPVLFFYTFAQLLPQLCTHNGSFNSIRRFGFEFVLSVIPTIICINVINDWVEYIVGAFVLCSFILIWYKRCFTKARGRDIDIGARRPRLLTLARATINFLTVLCILAIDFDSFPRQFRKTRRFGASLMDVGIGLFVFSMALVSRPLRRFADIKRLIYMVAMLLILGGVRTIVIIYIDYHQDEHEYGTHLNAFFTLGLTKLFGGLISFLAYKDETLFPIGIVILAFHQLALEMGLSNYVMDDNVNRTTFWSSNREGLSSLPGFVGLYIITMHFGGKFKANGKLTYEEFMLKFKSLALSSVVLWLLLIISTYYFGIARVTCNMSYAIWMVALGVTMSTLYMFAFDFVLDTLWPLSIQTRSDLNYIEGAGDAFHTGTLNSPLIDKTENTPLTPSIVEAINYNSLVFFLIGNILTGGVNIFLKPEERTTLEGVFILTIYMFISTTFVYILYRFKIRIA